MLPFTKYWREVITSKLQYADDVSGLNSLCLKSYSQNFKFETKGKEYKLNIELDDKEQLHLQLDQREEKQIGYLQTAQNFLQHYFFRLDVNGNLRTSVLFFPKIFYF